MNSLVKVKRHLFVYSHELLPSLEQIRNLQTSPWDFGNHVLYDLCRENFSHEEIGKVIAKVWLIGRAYAAAIERRKNKESINDSFYIDHVAPAFINSEIDHHLNFLQQFICITEDNLPEILKAHFVLTKLTKSLTLLEKRAFCSKYLHFHLPELFFIYDSRVVMALRQFNIKVPESMNPLLQSKQIDLEYAKYVCKCLFLKNNIKLMYGIDLSPRHLDNILIEIANKHLTNSAKQENDT